MGRDHSEGRFDLKRTVDRFESDRRRSVERVLEESAALEEARNGAETVEEARRIVQAVSAAVQREAHRGVASVVSRCLEAVFDDPYEFRIEFEERRGKTEAELLFARDGAAVDPMSAAGGGVVDVAAFALRAACLMLGRPARRRLLVLDEPFRFVSRDLRPRIRAMVETLAEEMGIQFVIVTHDPALICGKVVEVGR